ncbi:MAG TPA: M48 family metallopeptidase [Sphingomonas sp.]|nr:M48 family metallopeptidase [Sphingomonas sp.]
MPSTSAPSEPAAPVWHYDGRSALRQDAALIAEGECFHLAIGAREDGPYCFADLEPHERAGGDAVYGLAGRPGWRIGFVGEPPAAIAARLPGERRYGRWVDRFGLWRSVAAFAVLAAIIVVLVLRTPAAVARIVPPSVERQLGDAMIGDLGGHVCNGRGGQAALDRIAAELGSPGRPVDVRVANVPVVNAVTLPGGHIIVFDKLIQEARSPDEVAGVIGHEMGHVAHRDVLAGLIRQMGLSVLLGGMEGHVGGTANALVSARYSRTAEADADAYAIAALDRAHISPLPTARFFHRLAAIDGSKSRDARVIAYLASHPLSTTRERRFVAAARSGNGYRPALSPDQWAQLRAICSADPSVQPFTFGF